jgi:starch-binding outer membrane protein, SusD/RagB family
MQKMNKIIIQSAIIISAISIGFSCKKIINQKPETIIENENVINSVKDLESVLNGAYDGLQGGNVLGGNMIFYSDLLADDADVKLSRLSAFGTNEIYYGNTSVQIGALRDMWRDCYSTINRANNVISIIDNNTKLSGAEYESKKDRIRAEAVFIRALVHYELLRFWAQPYNPAKPGANTQAGIVIRTKPTLSIDSLDAYKKPRASVEEVYSFVIEELKKADVAFQSFGTISKIGYGSSNACKAILARVYYYKGDNENAANYAQQVISTADYQLNDSLNILNVFRNQDVTPRKSNEPIFEIINTSADNSNPLQGYYSRGADYYFRIPQALMELQYTSDDYRRKKLLIITGASSFTSKYDIPSGQIGGANVTYIRLAEMYLILAECKANLGDNTTALINYNKIRGRAFANYIPETSTTDLLTKIWAERRRELAFEGDRYMFLRKNKLSLRNGTEYQKYLFKIPQEEIAGNPDIVQN